MHHNTPLSAAILALRSWAPSPAPTVLPPDADVLLGGFDAPAWLTAPLVITYDRSVYSIAAAVGTLGRLWMPHGRTTHAAAMDRLMNDDDPMARAVRWFAALHPDARDVVAELACVEADRLADEASDVETPEDATAWCERRDDLESVVVLLHPAYRDPVAVCVAACDRHARTEASRLRSARRTPRLAALRWQSPDAWWTV